MAWLLVFAKGKQHTVKEVPRNELAYICLSGVATGGSWLCYYKALQDGPASAVLPIDKFKHSCFNSLFIHSFQRKTVRKIKHRSCYDNSRHPGYAFID